MRPDCQRPKFKGKSLRGASFAGANTLQSSSATRIKLALLATPPLGLAVLHLLLVALVAVVAQPLIHHHLQLGMLLPNLQVGCHLVRNCPHLYMPNLQDRTQ